MVKSLKQQRKIRRIHRTRTKILGTASRPRLSVFRSLKHIYAQVIDDSKGKTSAQANDLEIKKAKMEVKKSDLKGKNFVAYQVGLLIAKRALEKDVKKVVFDRGSFLYHGRVKALADGAREGGLEF
jgi:large subunit ribosomal protein L18